MSTRKNGQRLSRRGFLKAVGVGGVGLLTPRAAQAAASDRTELATLLDLSKCVGCGACVEACGETNGYKYPEPEKPIVQGYPQKRVKIEDWSDRRDVDDRLTPYNWLYIQAAEVEHDGKTHELYVPRRCMHCTNPPCANLCPFGACYKQPDGVVRINDDICLGGSKCRAVCPWKIPQRQSGVGLYLHMMPELAGNGVMYKCDRCHQRLEKGQVPACIEACPFDVQSIGPREEMVARAHELAGEMNGYIYGETENGGTNTLYVSPVPFEKLDEAVEKGPGRPGLQKAPDMMAKDQNLATAALVAPLAGLAAGALGVFGALSREEDDDA